MRKHRTAQGLSLAETAALAYGDEAKASRISELENGRVNRPHAKTVSALSRALKIPEDEVSTCQRPPLYEPRTADLMIDEQSNNHLPLLLATADLQFSAKNAMNTSIANEIDNLEITEKGKEHLDRALRRGYFQSRESVHRLLVSPIAQDIMFLIWRESDYVSEEALTATSSKKMLADDYLTRNSLTNLICEGSNLTKVREADALRRQVHRIVEALSIMGLVEQVVVRSNLKPLKATIKLDGLVRRALLAVSRVFADTLSLETEIKENSRPDKIGKP